MTPRRYDITGWSRLPLPPRNIRLRTDGQFEILTDRAFALDVKADHASDTVLFSLDMTDLTDANGIRRIDASGLRLQVDAGTMAATYAALCLVHKVRPGGDAAGVYDLRSLSEDGFAEIPLEGAFIIKASATQP